MQTRKRRDVLLAMVPYSPWRGEGVRRFAREAGWNLLEWSSLPGGIGGWRGDGALVTLRNDPELAALVRRLRRRGVPVVDMTAEHPEIRIPRVCLDSRVIGRMAAGHFAERNFRHAAWFSTQWTRTHAVRFSSFAEAWTALPRASGPPERHVLMEEMPRSRWNDSRAVGRWFASILRHAPKPLAVFCPGPAESSRVAAECRACGIAVPEEVAILCTGDDQMPCENQAVPLSCIIVGGERQGYEAAALLDRLIDGEPPPGKPVTMPPKGIVVRASTDFTAVSDPMVSKALALIAKNVSRPWGVAQLCAELGVGSRRLLRRFTAELGRAPGDEMLRQRLALSRSLLRETDLPLRDVAARCGLCHASYLTRLFRRDTGLPPAAWRRRGRPSRR